MSKFEISNKELKQLLQNEGMDEPSLSFNRSIMDEIAAYERTKSIKTPLLLKVLFASFMIIPVVLIFALGGIDLGLKDTLGVEEFKVSTPDLTFTLDNNYIYFMAFSVGIAWLSVFFYRMLTHSNNHSVKNS